MLPAPRGGRILTKASLQVNRRRSAGVLAVVVALTMLAPAASGQAATRARGKLEVLFLLAAFPDRQLSHGRRYFTDRETGNGLVERMVRYFAEVSAGRLELVPTVAGRAVVVPGLRASYVGRPGRLARDAFLAFSATASPAERAAISRAEALVVFFAGPGRESHVASGDPRDPWSNFTAIFPPLRAGPRGVLTTACVIAEEEVGPFSPFGVLCHEFGHLLGLPELYATGGVPQEGIGIWGLMGQGTWIGRGEMPPHPEAWSKAKLGWVDVELVEHSGRYTLAPVERVPRVLKIWARGPDVPEEYFLIENRQRLGADRGLPGRGLLVWHVDEGVRGFRTGENRVGHKRLDLLQADGRDDLDRGHARGGNRGDAGDPWNGPPLWMFLARTLAAAIGIVLAATAAAELGASGRRGGLRGMLVALCGLALIAAASRLGRGPVLGPDTNPSTAAYGGVRGRFILRDISPARETMTFTIELLAGAHDE